MRKKLHIHLCLILAIFSLAMFSRVYADQGQPQKPSLSLYKAILQSDTALHVKLKVQILLTSYYSRTNGDSANYYADLALLNSKIVKIDSFTANAKNNKSTLLMSQMRFQEALDYAFEALEYYEEAEKKVNASHTEDNIGNIFYSIKRYEDAKVYYLRAMANRIERGDSLGIAVSHLNLGSLYNRAGKQLEAIAEQKLAHEMATTLNHDDLRAITCNNLSLALMELERFDEAETYLKESIEISSQKGNKIRLCGAYQKMGQISHHRKDYDSAIVYYGKSIEIGNEMQEFLGHSDIYESLASIYEEKGEFGKSIQYLRLVQEIKDTAFSKDLEENVAKFKVQYETDRLRREKMVALSDKKEIATALVIQKSENEITNLKLSRNYYIIAGLLVVLLLIIAIFVVLQMRSKLKAQVKLMELKQSILQAQMNPHFIFNALNSIQNQILNRDRKDAYAYHSKFSELMRTVLEASNRPTISLEEEVEAISNYLELEQLRTDNKFDFAISVDPKLDLRTTLVPPLLIQPFAENSVWHGLVHKEGKGHIKIDISARPDGIRYLISDNGIGRSRSAEINQQKTKNHESRGVNVTNNRVRYFNLTHGRNLEMHVNDLVDTEGKPSGTSVEIEIPYI